MTVEPIPVVVAAQRRLAADPNIVVEVEPGFAPFVAEIWDAVTEEGGRLISAIQEGVLIIFTVYDGRHHEETITGLPVRLCAANAAGTTPRGTFGRRRLYARRTPTSRLKISHSQQSRCCIA